MWWRGPEVRIVHEPSGMEASANDGRSMVRMRDACRRVLKGKLWHLENGYADANPTDVQREIAERVLKKLRRQQEKSEG